MSEGNLLWPKGFNIKRKKREPTIVYERTYKPSKGAKPFTGDIGYSVTVRVAEGSYYKVSYGSVKNYTFSFAKKRTKREAYELAVTRAQELIKLYGLSDRCVSICKYTDAQE